MAYDAELADRVRAVVQAEDGLTERRMFGGLAFLIQGQPRGQRQQPGRPAAARRPGRDRVVGQRAAGAPLRDAWPGDGRPAPRAHRGGRGRTTTCGAGWLTASRTRAVAPQVAAGAGWRVGQRPGKVWWTASTFVPRRDRGGRRRSSRGGYSGDTRRGAAPSAPASRAASCTSSTAAREDAVRARCTGRTPRSTSGPNHRWGEAVRARQPDHGPFRPLGLSSPPGRPAWRRRGCKKATDASTSSLCSERWSSTAPP